MVKPRVGLLLFLLFFSFTFLGILPSVAQDTLLLTKSDDYLVKNNNLRFCFDFSKDSLSFSGIQSFVKLPEGDTLKGYYDKEYWIRFIVKNDFNTPHSQIFELQNPWTNQVQLFEVSNLGILEYPLTGIDFKFSSRPVEHKNFVFIPTFEPNEVKVFYIKVKSTSFNTTVLRIRSLPYFIWYAISEYYILGIFYGLLVLVFLYNAFLFISLKERIYFFYLLYVFSCGLYAVNEDGTAFQYIWPNGTSINYWNSVLTPLIFIFSFSLYSSVFLKMGKRMILILIGLNVVYTFFFLVHRLNWIPLDIAYYFSASIFVFIFCFGLYRAYQKNKQSYYFLAAYSFIIVGVMLNILRNAGLVMGDSYYSAYGLNFGFIIEVFVFSIALSERFKSERIEKMKANEALILQLKENEKLKDSINRELEEKVALRTSELVKSNSELEQANFKLQEQAETIEKMNLLLTEDNIVLKKDVQEQTKARAMAKDMSFEEFSVIFPDDESCLKYISEIKWTGEFVCKRCGKSKYFAGRAPYSRRCTHCGYEESATNATIFHRCKIPLHKAFYMVYLVSSRKEDVTSEELSQKLQIRQKTCWSFKQKISQASLSLSKGSKKKHVKEWNELILAAMD